MARRRTNAPHPVTVRGLTEAATITAGSGQTCALRANGIAQCWGDNEFGQLGDGTLTSHSTPVAVTNLTNAVAVTAGGGHSCALRGDGVLRCWGLNIVGELGDGTTADSATPNVVTGGGGGISARDVSTANTHSCAVRASGAAACWGRNGSGALGDGTTTMRACAPAG